MPLPSPHGSYSPPSTQSDYLKDKDLVRDLQVNKTAFIENDWPDATETVALYAEGHPFTVTYYTSLSRDGLQRSSPTDLTAKRDHVTLPLLKISNFELKTPEPFSFSYDPDLTENGVTGNALVYPGFEPRIGDVFTYALDSGHVGQFRVSDVEPLSYFSKRLHRISFYLNAFLDNEARDLLDDRVARKVVFSKQGVEAGDGALLTSNAWTYLTELRKIRSALLGTWFHRHWNGSMGTCVDTDGTYDPYVIRFITAIAGYGDYPRVPAQLFPEVEETFPDSFLSRLISPHDPSFVNLTRYAETVLERNAFHDVTVTALLNRERVILKKEETDDTGVYILSDAFYDADAETMTDLETLVHEAITTKTIADVGVFYTDHVKDWTTVVDGISDFHRLPILIRLIDIALAALRSGAAR